MTSGQAVRSITKFPVALSEARRDARSDHFEKHRRPVMEPQHQRKDQERRAQSCAPNRNGAGEFSRRLRRSV
jgi:hypothetical protein